jgi:hypothetical protein
MKYVAKMLEDSTAFSIQVGGNLSKQTEDSKFTSCRIAMFNVTVQTVFLLMHSSDSNGAVNKFLRLNGCSNSPELMGITTDGEYANIMGRGDSDINKDLDVKTKATDNLSSLIMSCHSLITDH